ncbi:AraC family transcriptional regulator [Cohnella thailandensis]|uniref:AraC family transcriptional regulator n=1 Tax=Cohnella thailandensis TaxID=557557 RepID=A0A841T2M3_9BACL|nr:AraC family transcriptional regulator [Cohnella thailandensis]MBB6637852.1 AraC family transcriptional regulator [Cohnella thailandensis]MBP1977441.1 AraC-like DNA-binding protein [Cohnella thailandensis]
MSPSHTYQVVSHPFAAGPDRQGEPLSVLFAGESQTKPEHKVGPKVVDYFLLHHVLSGRGTFVSGDLRAELRAGQSFLIHPGHLVSYESDPADPWRYLWIAFAGPLADELARNAGLSVESPIADTGSNPLPAACFEAIFETFRLKARSASLKAAGQLHLLLAELREAATEEQPAPLRPESHSEELVRQVASYLATQYAEPVTIESMSESLGYNRAYLSRIFKQHTGLTPISFLTRTRIDHGRRLLRERPELTVEQIASSVGYPDALYFSKQFRKRCGQTPSEYRASVIKP